MSQVVKERPAQSRCDDFKMMGVRKGRSFLKPLIRPVERCQTRQLINGMMEVRPDGQMAKHLTHLKFDTTVIGNGLLSVAGEDREPETKFGIQKTPKVYATDFMCPLL
ncbi:unnamed protein product [Lymnaea stagnalis]|uniref:Uncharacterized protein n=1 Tax=Lymnaea stagnalis TaxID=6523 RepID=A0AAV2GYD2_LYMST